MPCLLVLLALLAHSPAALPQPGDPAADEATVRRLANQYAGPGGLLVSKGRGRALDKPAAGQAEKMERLLLAAKVDATPMLIEAFRASWPAMKADDPAGYACFNFSTRPIGGDWPRRAMELIGKMVKPAHADAMVALLFVQDLAVVDWAAETIAAVASPPQKARIAADVAKVLARGERWGKLGAATAYARIAPDRPVPLVAALKDADWMVRRRAVRSLGLARVVQARPAIAALLNDTDLDVRLEAKRALILLEGKPLPWPGRWGPPAMGPAAQCGGPSRRFGRVPHTMANGGASQAPGS